MNDSWGLVKTSHERGEHFAIYLTAHRKIKKEKSGSAEAVKKNTNGCSRWNGTNTGKRGGTRCVSRAASTAGSKSPNKKPAIVSMTRTSLVDMRFRADRVDPVWCSDGS